MTTPRSSARTFTTLSLTLIPVAVAVNYVGGAVARVLRLPLFLDSIGTVLAAILAGPWVGAAAGAVNNIFLGLTVDATSFWYAITSIAIGLVAGLLAQRGWFTTVARTILAGLVLALVADLVSTPINVLLWEGQSGVPLGDAVYAALLRNGVPLYVSSFLGELLIDVPDKIVAALLAYGIVIALPDRLRRRFGGPAELQRL